MGKGQGELGCWRQQDAASGSRESFLPWVPGAARSPHDLQHPQAGCSQGSWVRRNNLPAAEPALKELCKQQRMGFTQLITACGDGICSAVPGFLADSEAGRVCGVWAPHSHQVWNLQLPPCKPHRGWHSLVSSLCSGIAARGVPETTQKPTLVCTNPLSSVSTLGKVCLARDEVAGHCSAGMLRRGYFPVPTTSSPHTD